MSTARMSEVELLETMRDFARIAGKIGVVVPNIRTAPADTCELIDWLFAQPPPITWDGEVIHSALLLELGERAARALRLARRRARRK